MYKALVEIDSFVRLPSGRVAVVVKHTEGEGVLCEYVDGGGEVEVIARYLRPVDEPV